MTKEHLHIEFRYHDEPDSTECITRSETITIGIYDTIEEAVSVGNVVLDKLSQFFEVRPNDKFKVNGLFGKPDRLVSNCCYTTKGISYFFSITTLKFEDPISVAEETFKAYERYMKYLNR